MARSAPPPPMDEPMPSAPPMGEPDGDEGGAPPMAGPPEPAEPPSGGPPMGESETRHGGGHNAITHGGTHPGHAPHKGKHRHHGLHPHSNAMGGAED